MRNEGTAADHQVFIDTDIGSDLDDALAIAYLLARRDVDIVGITTTTGKPQLRAALANALVDSLGSDMRARAGESVAIAGEQLQPDVPQAGVLPAQHPAIDDAAGDGVEFLIDVARNSTNALTLLCLAPLTTVARAFQAAPDIVGAIGQVVVMGGHFCGRAGRPSCEWNFVVDPEAARYVLSRTSTRIVGLDVTHDVSFTSADLDGLAAASHRLQFVQAMGQAHFARYPEVYLHDVLAAAVALDPSYCTFVEGSVSVSVQGEDRGTSRLGAVADGRPAHTIATQVDRNRFLRDVRAVLSDLDRS
jgi:purine nucleosidase